MDGREEKLDLSLAELSREALRAQAEAEASAAATVLVWRAVCIASVGTADISWGVHSGTLAPESERMCGLGPHFNIPKTASREMRCTPRSVRISAIITSGGISLVPVTVEQSHDLFLSVACPFEFEGCPNDSSTAMELCRDGV